MDNHYCFPGKTYTAIITKEENSDMQKTLLVLGGTAASLDIVKIAREIGVYTIVTDDRQDGAAKPYADEVVQISTTDHYGLVDFIRERGINGVLVALVSLT